VIAIKLFIISAGAAPAITKKDESSYTLKFTEDYAQRFIKHLKNDETLCTACGKDCISCRLSLADDLSDRIAGHLKLPILADQFIDNPEDYLPEEFPSHDVTIAINVHSDLLLDVPVVAARAGSKALIVPVEDPDWIGGWTKKRLEEKCTELGMEFAAPKPFCNLTSDGYVHINRFIKEFRIGRPRVGLIVDNGIIKHVEVIVSAPCGATYHLARIFEGLKADKKVFEVACKGLSSYPCTASTKVDSELKDSITHKANYIMIDVLKGLMHS